ncbi:MAG: sensor histidine kinase [Spirochaetales bacterium]|nr:sensor histidine kinase [Spirochaetales bacterium]
MTQSRFRDRMLFSFLTIIVLPVVILGILGPVLYSREVASLSARHTRELVERVTLELESTIDDRVKLMNLLLESRDIKHFFQGDSGDDVIQGMDQLFASVASSHLEVSGLLALRQDDRHFSRELTRILRDPLIDEDWYHEATMSDSQFLLSTRPIGRNLRYESGTEPDEIVSLIRTVQEGNQVLGVLLLDIHLEYLAELLQGTQDSSAQDSGFFCILDQRDNVVYSPENPVVYRINPSWFVKSDQIIEREIQGQGYRFIFSESSYTGWKTVGVYDLEDALGPVRFVQWLAFVIASLTLALSFGVSMVYTSAISKPIIRLRSVMERVGEGNLKVRYEGKSRDEIDELGEGFNAMLVRIEGLLELVYQEQQSKREAELRIMQQQIKPHFLYNTLDTILWMAEENQSEQIVDLVTALTKLFRIALSQGAEEVRLKEELEHVQSYLIIQKTRYEDQFDYTLDCSEDLHHFRVQKMILQPLVENALYHGIKEKGASGQIDVQIRRVPQGISLVVEDDGVGIPVDSLTLIRQGLHQFDHKNDRTAFALYNVNDRIRLTYGADYGLTIDSHPGKGTRVEIIHPIDFVEGGE